MMTNATPNVSTCDMPMWHVTYQWRLLQIFQVSHDWSGGSIHAGEGNYCTCRLREVCLLYRWTAANGRQSEWQLSYPVSMWLRLAVLIWLGLFTVTAVRDAAGLIAISSERNLGVEFIYPKFRITSCIPCNKKLAGIYRDKSTFSTAIMYLFVTIGCWIRLRVVLVVVC